MSSYILVINPGSTSTKIGLFSGQERILETNVFHEQKEMLGMLANEECEYRQNIIVNYLKKHQIDFSAIKLIMARGGLLRPIKGGVYLINDLMVSELQVNKYGYHASNLGALIAFKLATALKIKSYIVDPVVVDEMIDIAKMTGLKTVQRKSIFHALNHKHVAKKVARSLNQTYENSNFVVAHLGGGISIGTHWQGQVVDVNNALDGEGPFSSERVGTVPWKDLLDWCYRGKYDQKTLTTLLLKSSGVSAYFHTNDLKTLLTKVNDDQEIKLVFDALIYQVAKSIASCTVFLKGKLDAIILTGGLAYSEYITSNITTYVEWIAPVKILAGESELEALNEAGVAILQEQATILTY